MTRPVSHHEVDLGEGLWAGVDRLVDRADSLVDLRAHALHLLAADRWRRTGRTVPHALAIEELVAAHKTAAAAAILRSARAAYHGQMVLLKGPEVAALYPSPVLRPSGDLDILVEDAEQAQRALTAAGFVPIGPFDESYYEGLQHLRPLQHPEHPVLRVELHRRPNWVDWSEPPDTAELLETAGPGAAGIPGVLALPAPLHAVAIAVHSWGVRPLRRLLDLIDVAAVSEGCRDEAYAQARAWRLPHLWRTTRDAIDALVFGAPEPLSLRLWARDLADARARTVFEDHVRRWLGPFWALPPHRAVGAAVVAVARDATPAPTETWGSKLGRTREAVLHPRRAQAEHARRLGPEGVKPRLKRR